MLPNTGWKPVPQIALLEAVAHLKQWHTCAWACLPTDNSVKKYLFRAT